VDVSFFAAVLLFVNALAVLNEQRLLQKSTPPPIYLFILWQLTSLLNMRAVGWAYNPTDALDQDSVKQKITHLLYSIRFLLRSTLLFAFRCVLLLIPVCRDVPQFRCLVSTPCTSSTFSSLVEGPPRVRARTTNATPTWWGSALFLYK
jgi:hypothetical protein